MNHAIFRLHHGAAGSINVWAHENAEVFEPKTPRNMVPMSEDAHLGGGSHDALPAAKPEADTAYILHLASPPPVAKSTKKRHDKNAAWFGDLEERSDADVWTEDGNN
ncbi:MAG TPA: hypothetical protein VEW05_14410 [Candidatus Polarisedimenticolia bacterium]|nr:hypothetical protein [Candidatus Polarisedimenticolia bacterium]